MTSPTTEPRPLALDPLDLAKLSSMAVREARNSESPTPADSSILPSPATNPNCAA